MNVTSRVHRRGLAGLVLAMCLLLISGLFSPQAGAEGVGDKLGNAVPGTPTELPGPPGLVQPTAIGNPQPTYGANRNHHIVLINGYLTSSEGKKDVNGEWSNVIPALQGWGWPSGKDSQNRDWIGGVSIYACDENLSFNTGHYGKDGVADIHALSLGPHSQALNHQGQADCGSLVFPRSPTTPHTTETTIEHLAYHWAWTIKHTFGTECIKVLAHSMGGLVIRYALQRVQAQDADFPWDICVDDVVSFGTPYNGSPSAGVWCPDIQCAQQANGSSFLNTLAQNPNPQAAGGTDWTALGSTDDGTAPAGSATYENFDPNHWVVYENDGIKHSSFGFASLYWKNATSGDRTADIRWKDKALGFEATSKDAPWPIRYADMSLAYNQWGCGVDNTNSAWPLKKDVATVGEFYTTSSDCWYYIDVPAGNGLKVTATSLNGRDIDLYLRPGTTLGQPPCQAFNGGSTETCSIASPSATRWYAQVSNFDDTRDPFTIEATYQNDCSTGVEAGDSFSAATTLTLPKTSCPAELRPMMDTQDYYQFTVTSGQRIDIAVSPPSGGDFDLCLYDPNGNQVGSCSTAGVGQVDSIVTTATMSGNYRARVYSFGNAYSGIYAFWASAVTPQNDCGTGSDAGGTFSGATSLAVPQSGCSGQLIPVEGDTSDYYKFPVSSVGTQISTSVTNNALSNFDVCIYNPSGTLVSGCTTGSTGGTDSLNYTTTTTGDFRVRVRQTSGTGPYGLSLSTTSQNDCTIGGDAGNSFSAASSLSLPKSNCTGTLIDGSDTEDWYQFSVTSGQTISGSLTNNASSDYDICIYNPSNVLVAGCTVGTTGGTDTLSHTATTTGSYRFRVMRFSGTGNYTMSLSVSTASQNDCGTGVDASNSLSAPTSLSVPQSGCTGTLVYSSDLDDYYQFPVTSGQTIDASMTNNASSDYDICIYNPSGNLVAGCTIGTIGGTDTLTHTATTTGNYRFQVTRWSGTGNYTMSLLVSGGTVTIRDDDGTRETSSPMNYGDDTAVKRLSITSAQLSGKTTATLYVYGQSYSCTGSGNKYSMYANNNFVSYVDPCAAWSSSSYSWKSFTVPIGNLTSGTNTFHLGYNGPQDWMANNVNIAVDSTTPDNDDISYDGNSVSGRLMWYLALS